MSSKKRWIAAVGAATLVAGLLAVAVPAGAGLNGEDKPWPILQVMKTIGQAEQITPGATIEVPPETVFTIHVSCESPVKEVGAEGFADGLETDLLFDYQGLPTGPPPEGWADLGDGYWTFQGKELTYTQCTAVETNVDPEPETLDVAYKCDAEAAEVEPVLMEDADAQLIDGAEFGCIEPLPEGEYESSPPAEAASIQFTAFWDFEACGLVPAEGVSDQSKIKCQQTGTLTVDNLDPVNWVVSPENVVALEIVPTFTG